MSTASSERGPDGVVKMFGLTKKNFVITGGARGIGYAITRAIAELGGNVAVIDTLDCPVEDFEMLSKNADIKKVYIKADVTDEKSLTDAFDEATTTLEGIDGCVTAAGISLDKPFLEHTWEETARLQNVNVLGTFFSAQLAAKQMLKQGNGGSIVMIASHCAHHVAPGHRLSAYHASKAGVAMLSRAIGVELAASGVRCNTVSPGYIETAMTQAQREQQPHLVQLMNEAPPMKRIGQPSDLVGAVAYLLSDASKYTTGTNIEITGGLHVGMIDLPAV